MNSPTIGQWIALAACFLLVGSATVAGGQDFDRPPINYDTSTPSNDVSELQDRLAAGKANLKYEDEFGYLRSVLTELGVPESSQMLVFSKTSLQRHRIAPSTPRAIYFSDSVYVGYCQSGDVLEISAVDPKLGTVYYTLEQEKAVEPRFVRQTDSCLLCHGSSHNQGVPGHVVRSVFSDPSGLPILSSGSYRIDHTSLLERRWGGWYVTGTHGDQKHLGNLIVRGRREPEQVDNSDGLNVKDLTQRFDTSKYLTPHSDLVALMVLEHQAQAHNLIARANFLTEVAMHHEASLNKELGKPLEERWESTNSRIKDAGEPLVKYLLFSEEAKLTAPIEGTSSFREEFSARGPRDPQGRSLRDFDLTRRMFKYPCSYLIYSPEFEALPQPVKDYVWQRLWDILRGEDPSDDFAHLSPADRQSIREILASTKTNLPDYWQAAVHSR